MSWKNLLAAIFLLPAVAWADTPVLTPDPSGIKGENTSRQLRDHIPFPAPAERWLRARSKHFVFISSADENRTRAVAAELETLAAALTQVDSTFSASSAAPTRVILFSNRREVQPYFDALRNRRDSDVSGVFVSQSDGGTMLINDGSTWRGGDRPPLHELVHYLLHSGDAQPPLWLDEGLAEYFSNATIRRGSISAGEPMRNHMATLRQRIRIPPAELFSVTRQSDTYNLSPGRAFFYAESWAIVDWLVRTSTQNGAGLYAFVHDVSHGVPVATALQTRYHLTLRDVDWALSRLVRSPGAGVAITIPVPATETSVVVAPIDRATILYELGHFLAGTENLSDEAERHFRAALAVDPQHARSLAGLASLRAAKAKYAEATPLLEKAIALDPDDTDVALSYAEVLMQDQTSTQGEDPEAANGDALVRFRKARALIQRTLAHRTEPDFPTGRVLGDLGATYGAENDVAPGIVALEEARRLLPPRTDYAIHLLALYRRNGDRAKAGALLAELDAVHDPQVSSAARSVIPRAELARANALAHEQRLDEAAAVLRELAAGTADPDTRRNYETQAAEWTRAAANNRETEQYNEIVAQVSAGRYQEAIKALAAFLPKATDPNIVRDAKELQKQLGEWKP
jgi:tetratricopeptide (TPR) repeat protein